MPPKGGRKRGPKPRKVTEVPEGPLVEEGAPGSPTGSGIGHPPGVGATQGTPHVEGPDPPLNPSSPQAKKKKESRPCLKLKKEDEETAISFVEKNQELYSKGHHIFYKQEHKNALWAELAQNLNVTDLDGEYKIREIKFQIY